ncbi:MAG: GAF domain-containing protein [Anaerolineae bacterium]|nr:GAF domain-containing protein [Anaerolineae bacterium]
MGTNPWLAVIQLVWGGIYILSVGIVFRRQGLNRRVAHWLLFYLVLSSLRVLSQALYALDGNSMPTATLLASIPPYTTLCLALVFLQLSRSVLRFDGRGWGGWVVGGLLAAALLVLNANPFALPQVMWAPDGHAVRRDAAVVALQVAGWAIFLVWAAILTLRAYARTDQPLHKNRITYWLFPLGAVVLGDALFFSGSQALSGVSHLLAVFLALYVALSYDLPDARQMLRRGVGFAIVALLTVGVYTAGFAAAQSLFSAYPPLTVGLALALVLVLLVDPLLTLPRRVVRRWVYRARYDPSQTVREYSLSISNILDLERLTTVAVGLISEALEIKRGVLFLVYSEQQEEAALVFLRGVKGMGIENLEQGILTADSPIATYMRQECRPLPQYNLDMLPQFQDVPPQERKWFAGLGMDVYVPIQIQGQWIGLLALGAKRSGDPYYADDLTLLSTLADQTAVALQNARLVDDLKRAYADLDRANRQLQEMDELKSAFIGVVTHELRTPLSNLDFSMQLLKRYGVEHLSTEQREQIEQLNSGIKSAKTMVDNLVTFATFISKQGELRMRRFDVREALQETVDALAPVAQVKGVALHVETAQRMPLLHGDRARISDALYHLLQNAIKFSSPGGAVWVRCTVEADALRFEVQDQGVGVPPEKLPGLWDAFTQMADPLRRGVEGLGLGLALVKYAATAHGGDVFAQSAVGAGSTFGFWVPLVEHAPTAMPALSEIVAANVPEPAPAAPPEPAEGLMSLAEFLEREKTAREEPEEKPAPRTISDYLEELGNLEWNADG